MSLRTTASRTCRVGLNTTDHRQRVVVDNVERLAQYVHGHAEILVAHQCQVCGECANVKDADAVARKRLRNFVHTLAQVRVVLGARVQLQYAPFVRAHLRTSHGLKFGGVVGADNQRELARGFCEAEELLPVSLVKRSVQQQVRHVL